MKIIRFTAENFKGLKAVEINPTGDVVTLTGRNGAGKSSVLDAITAALCGGPMPVRAGETRSEVVVTLGDDNTQYQVRRVCTEKGDRLEVKNTTENTRYGSPREMLNKMVGNIAIDPLGFVKSKPAEQIDTLFNMMPELRVRLEEADREIAKIKQLRSDNLAQQRIYDSQIKTSPIVVVPEMVDVAALEERLKADEIRNNEIYEHNREISKAAAELTRRQDAIDRCEDDIARINRQMAALAEEKAAAMEKLDGIISVSPPVVGEELQYVDSTETRRLITEAHENNRKASEIAAKNKATDDAIARLDGLKTGYAAAGVALKDTETAKAGILSGALPLPGLSVEGRTISYNGVPLADLSTGEKIRVGVAMAQVQNPKAKIILVDDASLLDSANMAILHEACDDGYQVWEVVNDESGNVGITIEDGTIIDRSVENE